MARQSSTDSAATLKDQNAGGDSGTSGNNRVQHKEIEESAAKSEIDSSTQTVSDPGSATALVLDRSLCVAGASQLYAEIKDLLQNKTGVDIDASGVETVDACGLQLLLGFVRSANEQDIPVRWKQPSGSFLEAAELLDMKTQLGL